MIVDDKGNVFEDRRKIEKEKEKAKRQNSKQGI